jgi:hypothetical protein
MRRRALTLPCIPAHGTKGCGDHWTLFPDYIGAAGGAEIKDVSNVRSCFRTHEFGGALTETPLHL